MKRTYAFSAALLVVALIIAACVAAPQPQSVRGFATPGDTDLTNLVVSGNTTIGGALTVTGQITGGSFSPTTFSNADDLTANTGNFTTTLKVALTPVARLSGSAIDAATLKVALTPVALLSGSTINGAALSVAGTPVAVQLGALSAGNIVVCGSTTVTGTATLPHGLATPSFVNVSLAADATGDCTYLSFTNASATVTAKCWNSALTPAPATTPVAVNWCVNGKP